MNSRTEYSLINAAALVLLSLGAYGKYGWEAACLLDGAVLIAANLIQLAILSRR